MRHAVAGVIGSASVQPAASHGLPQFALGPDHGQVHRIAQHAVAGAGAADEVIRNVEAAQDLVDAWQQRIRGDQPHRQEHPHLLGTPGKPGQQEVIDGPADGDGDQHVQQALHDGDDGSPAAAPAGPGAGRPRVIRLPGGRCPAGGRALPAGLRGPSPSAAAASVIPSPRGLDVDLHRCGRAADCTDNRIWRPGRRA